MTWGRHRRGSAPMCIRACNPSRFTRQGRSYRCSTGAPLRLIRTRSNEKYFRVNRVVINVGAPTSATPVARGLSWQSFAPQIVTSVRYDASIGSSAQRRVGVEGAPEEETFPVLEVGDRRGWRLVQVVSHLLYPQRRGRTPPPAPRLPYRGEGGCHGVGFRATTRARRRARLRPKRGGSSPDQHFHAFIIYLARVSGLRLDVACARMAVSPGSHLLYPQRRGRTPPLTPRLPDWGEGGCDGVGFRATNRASRTESSFLEAETRWLQP